MNIGEIYVQLTQEDFTILKAIEKAQRRGREYVPIDLLEKTTRIHEERLDTLLRKLRELKLVKKTQVTGVKAFSLTWLGRDMIALKELVNRGVLEAIDGKIGVGKESEIHLGLAPGNVKVAVKFLRIGRTSFRRASLVREWAVSPGHNWYKMALVAAEREYKALRELYRLKTRVPAPLGYNRHVVVIEYIKGVPLYTRPPLENPGKVLDYILDTLTTAYREVGIIHGDLSEYNILVKEGDETPFIIDWPQFVYKDHPNALELLKRDITYVVKFFKKVYGVERDLETVLNELIGNS